MKNKPKKSVSTDVKVIIGMPCTEMMKAKTAHAIGCLTIGDPTIVDFLMMQSCDIASARMWLVRRSIELRATHLLFVDSDMLFPTDTLKRLLAHDKDIIGVEYNKRKFPLETVTAYFPNTEKSETEPYKVGVAGTGVMLIKLSLFSDPKLDKNWFSFGRNAKGENVIGEDGWFCNTARDAGYDVWVDPTIKVLHLGEYGY
jgi:hypothetical protein